MEYGCDCFDKSGTCGELKSHHSSVLEMGFLAGKLHPSHFTWKMFQKLTWNNSQCAIAFGFVLLLAILYFPETSWHREEMRPRETGSTSEKVPHGLSAPGHISPSHERASMTTSMDSTTWKRIMGVQHVRMGSLSQLGRKTWSPLTLAWYPGNVWASLVWMVTFTWIIVQGGVATQIWGAAPYNMTPSAVGNLVGIAPLIGSLLGCIVGGSMSDWIARTMTRRNSGVYEPEYRLTLMLPSMLLMAVGSFGLGESVRSGESALVDGVFLALINAAVGLGCTCVVAYTNDTAGERAGEAFGLAMLTKSAYAFALTFVLNDYYSEQGPRMFFNTWAALTLGVMLFTLPLYVWGKRLRVWVEHHVHRE